MRQNDLILVIDPQNVYQPGQPWGCPSFSQSCEKIKNLLDTVEVLTAPPQVFISRFVANPQAEGVWAKYNRLNNDINADPWMNQLVPSLARYAQRFPVYQKSTYSSMSIPQLQEAVRALFDQPEENRGRVVLTGVVAECCVLATAMECIDMGCHILYLRDGCSGGGDKAEQSVITILEGLSPLHVTILTTAEYLNEPTTKNRRG